jgi:Tfp pilus assembly protein PilX
MESGSEKGIALISALLILVLLNALLVGFVLSVNSDQKLMGVDRDQNRAFYGSLAGLEKLTADLHDSTRRPRREKSVSPRHILCLAGGRLGLPN